MFDENGKPVEARRRPCPCRCWACPGAPNAGDELARRGERAQGARSGAVSPGQVPRREAREAGLEDRGRVRADGRAAKAGIIPILIKTDVQGSAEALRDALNKLSTDEVQVKVIASGVGGITESDVQLAAASKARIIGFNVRADAGARDAMKDNEVEVRYYSIIYEAIDDVKQLMTRPAGAGDQGADRRHRRRCARCSARASSAWSPAAW